MTPAHRPFSVLGEPRKDLVEIPSYVVAYGNHCTINERYPRTLAESIEFHEEHHFAEYTRHELYKAIIGYRMGELFVEAAADTILIILLKIAIGTEMIAYKNLSYFLIPNSRIQCFPLKIVMKFMAKNFALIKNIPIFGESKEVSSAA